jgi:hypothetical protein
MNKLKPLILDDSLVAAQGASEYIVLRLAGNGDDGRSLAFFDPTSGTKVIPPDLDRKIRKALGRAARQIALRLFFRSLLLKLGHFAVELRYARLKVTRYHYGCLLKLFEHSHDAPLSGPKSASPCASEVSCASAKTASLIHTAFARHNLLRIGTRFLLISGSKVRVLVRPPIKSIS